MRKSIQIRQDLQAKRTAQTAIVAGAKNEDGTKRSELTVDEATRFDALTDEITTLKTELVRAVAFEESDRESAAAVAAPVDTTLGDGEGEEKRSIQERFDVKRMLGIVVDRNTMDGVENEVNDIALQELRAAGISSENVKGFNIPASMAFRGAKGLAGQTRAEAHTATQDGLAFGGTTVQEVGSTVLPAFVDRMAIEDLGIKPKFDLVGNYTLHSVGDFEFQNVDETEALTVQKTGTSKRVLKPKRTGMMTYISNQLLVQSAINIMGVLSTRITEAMNRRLFIDLINGDGNEPNTLGLLNDAIAFDFPGVAGPLTLEKVLELEGEVDEENATENGRKFLIHTKLARLAKSIKIDAGSGMFLMDKDNMLHGMETKRTTLVPTLNANTEYPLIYGDWPSVEAGFWGGINLFADNITRANSNETRLIVNVHRDIMASNPKAFAVNKKITLV